MKYTERVQRCVPHLNASSGKHPHSQYLKLACTPFFIFFLVILFVCAFCSSIFFVEIMISCFDMKRALLYFLMSCHMPKTDTSSQITLQKCQHHLSPIMQMKEFSQKKAFRLMSSPGMTIVQLHYLQSASNMPQPYAH